KTDGLSRTETALAEFSAQLKQVHSDYCVGPSNLGKHLSTKLGQAMRTASPPEDVRARVEAFVEAFRAEEVTNKDLQRRLKNTRAGELDDWESAFRAHESRFEALAAQAAPLRATLDNLKTTAAKERAVAVRRRKAARKVALAAYIQGTGERWANYLVDAGLVAVELPMAVPEKYVPTLEALAETSILRPSWYGPQDTSPTPVALRKIRQGVKEDNLVSAKQIAAGHMRDTGDPAALVHLRIGGNDQYEGFGWLPPFLKDSSFLPEQVRCTGAPLFLATAAGSSNCGLPTMPMLGLGMLLLGVEGATAVLVYDLEYFVDWGVHPQHMLQWMAKNREFPAWASKHITHAILRPDSVCWVPYGFGYETIALQAQP
ncbi:MAG: hypothetical protein GY772_23190, partial [bacterium]|nr:hypothetical protein [bacterium]